MVWQTCIAPGIIFILDREGDGSEYILIPPKRDPADAQPSYSQRLDDLLVGVVACSCHLSVIYHPSSCLGVFSYRYHSLELFHCICITITYLFIPSMQNLMLFLLLFLISILARSFITAFIR